MYLDVKGLITIGVGNLIDPVQVALPLPFVRRSDGESATRTQIYAEWQAIKKNTALATQGHRAAARETTLLLADEAVGALIRERLQANEALLSKHSSLPAWDRWPADAQLGVHSMAWALGVGGLRKFPLFLMAAARSDFQEMARQCEISTQGNPGVKPRNEANRRCFENADFVSRNHLDREVLHYPEIATRPVEHLEEVSA